MDVGCSYKEQAVEFDSELFEPDFFLSQGLWTIVKGTFPTSEDKAKARSLAQRSGYPVYFFYGEIPIPAVPTSKRTNSLSFRLGTDIGNALSDSNLGHSESGQHHCQAKECSVAICSVCD
jgi:hypothetical protein